MMRLWHLSTLAVMLAAHASLPYYEGCKVGMPFGLPHGCAGLTLAALDLRPCGTEGVGPMEACVETSPAGQNIVWGRKVTSFEEGTSLLEAAIDAEGGGWGVHASAGIQGLMRSGFSSSAVSFVRADTRQVQEQIVWNANAMRLSVSAKQLLKHNPKDFVRRHGRRYVSSIMEGGTFVGSVSIHQMSSDLQSSLEAYADVSMEDTFSVTAKFKMARNQSSSTTEVVASYRSEGGTDIAVQTADGPAQIEEAYEAWQKTISKSPSKKLFLTARSWADLEEVQDILRNSSQDVKDLFDFPTIGDTTEKELSTEYGTLIMLMNDVSGAQDWKEVEQNKAWNKKLQKIANQVRKHQAKIESATEKEFLLLQKNILEGRDSPAWFKAKGLRDEWNKFHNDISKFQMSRSLPVHRYMDNGGLDFQYTASSPFPEFDTHRTVKAVFYCPPSDASGAEPVYSFYNRQESNHRYLMDKKWKRHGWEFQGTAFWAFKEKRDGTVPVFEAVSGSATAHKYVIDERLKGHDFVLQRDPLYYVYPVQRHPVFRYVFDEGMDYEYTVRTRPFHPSGVNSGAVFYCPLSDARGAKPVYSFYNRKESNHRYLMDKNWKHNDWEFQETAFWAFKEKRDGTVPVFEAASRSETAHKYVLESQGVGDNFARKPDPLYYVYESLSPDSGRRLSHTGTNEPGDNLLV